MKSENLKRKKKGNKKVHEGGNPYHDITECIRYPQMSINLGISIKQE